MAGFHALVLVLRVDVDGGDWGQGGRGLAGRCRPAAAADARRSWGLATVSRGGLTVGLMLREVEGVVPQAKQAVFGTC